MGRDQALANQRNTVVLTRPTARRTAISTAVALAVTPIAIHAGGWSHNSEVFISAGNKRNLLGGRALIPFRQDADSMWYADIRGFVSNHSTKEGNLGVGYRQFTDSGDWILGGYMAYDSRESRTSTHWDQITLGVEALSNDWDFRANLYHPLDNKELLYTQAGVGGTLTNATFSGYNLVSTFTGGSTINVYEEALDGFDIEAGRLLPFGPANHEIRGFLGLYHYDGDIVKDVDGISARLEWRPRRNITVNLQAQDDNLFDDSLRLEVAWSFDRPAKAGKRNLRDRMTQFVHRDIDIVETSPLPVDERTEKVGGGGGATTQTTATNIVHIDDSLGDTLGVVEGDGTAENPFRSFGECIQVAGARNCNTGTSVQYIYVHAGTGATYDTSDADGDGTGGDAAFQLQDGLFLAGEGAQFFTVPAGTAPLLSASGNPVITLVGNNTVQGVTINADHGAYIGITTPAYGGSTGPNTITSNTFDNLYQGIRIGGYGGGNETATITNNTFTNNGVGVSASQSDYYGSFTQNLTITGNTFDNNGYGVRLNNTSYNGGTSTQNATISGNTFSNNSYGVALNNSADAYYYYSGGTANQTVTLSGNTITGNNYGVVANNSSDSYYGYDGGTATQTLTISGNTITGNDYGIRLNNDSSGDYYGGEGGISTQTATLNNNTITGNQYTGVNATNDASYGGTANQTLNLTGNNISNNGASGYGSGIRVRNDADYYYGTATQTLNLTSNTIDNNAGYGISAYNNSGDYYYTGGNTATQTISMTGGGNTVSGNGYGAIYGGNYEYSGTATQNIDMSGGNTVNHPADTYFGNYGGTQNITPP